MFSDEFLMFPDACDSCHFVFDFWLCRDCLREFAHARAGTVQKPACKSEDRLKVLFHEPGHCLETQDHLSTFE